MSETLIQAVRDAYQRNEWAALDRLEAEHAEMAAWMAKVLGPFTMLFHRPSPGFILVTFSTNTMLSASGALAGSCATSAAT